MLIRLSENARLYHADCRDVIRELSDNSIDAVVTDPPYALVSIVKRFGGPNAAPAKGNDAYMRASAGFMGKQWDTGEVAFSEEFWAEVLRVLKPGGHVAAFGASRGYHRMACAIEDAGFEIRDSLMWCYATGFPKSLNVALAIDKKAGAIGHLAKSFNMKGGGDRSNEFAENGRDFSIRHEPVTDAARQWEGWGTALKPAFEPIVLARKPLSEVTVAANVLRWGTGALNIGACRVGMAADDRAAYEEKRRSFAGTEGKVAGDTFKKNVSPLLSAEQSIANSVQGRWPANVVHDGSDEVVGAFPTDNKKASGVVKVSSGGMNRKESGSLHAGSGMNVAGKINVGVRDHGDSGSAARFFYSAKASRADRAGSKHPTVKPIAIMQWLARLITPPGGTVLDPFAGSGTTGAACEREGFGCILVEREAEYVADIRKRFGARQVDPLARLLRWNAAVLSYRASLHV